MAINVFVAGDVVPREQTKDLFAKEDVKSIFGFMLPIIEECDLKLVNLEAPVVNSHEKGIVKCGPNLKTTSSTVITLSKAGINLFTLANNHFRDYGQNGVEETINEAKRCGIDVVGGGKNIDEAKQIYYYKKNDQILAIINVCEHEYSIATSQYGGSNSLDLVQIYDDIQTARSKADYIVVIVHGGVEHYQLPTPRMKKWYRFFIDLGADVVVNHHQHCLSGYELYKEKPIFYGLGNFIFDPLSPRKTKIGWYQGYAVCLIFDTKINFELIPYNQGLNSLGLSKRSYEEFNREIANLNSIIKDDGLLENEFEKYIKREKYNIFSYLWPFHSKYVKAMYKRGFLGKLFNKSGLLTIQNRTTCESHLDTLQQLTKSYYNEFSISNF